MTRHFFIKRLALTTAIVAALGGTSSGVQAEQRNEDTAVAVRRALERLPYYGVFDYLAYSVDRGVVTLTGYDYNGSLTRAAERAIKRVPGVDEVHNRVEQLPASFNDDRIRRATFYRIYTDSFLSRYTPGGERSAAYEALEFGRFPGRQPFGDYPIHIIVKGGRTTLVGIVDNASDRQLAEFRGREVSGVFGVKNDIVVRGEETTTAR